VGQFYLDDSPLEVGQISTDVDTIRAFIRIVFIQGLRYNDRISQYDDTRQVDNHDVNSSGGEVNRRKSDVSRQGELMRNLLNEVAYTYFPLRAFGDQMIARFGQSTAEWGLLRSLDERGEQTVAALARSRPVARQWIQRLANQLSRQGMLEFVENPDHKRAKLMRITPAGRTLLAQITTVLEPRAAAMQREFDERELSRTVDTLRKLRQRLTAEYRRPKGSGT